MTFLKNHSPKIWAADFFTEQILTPFGFVTAYVLFFIHHQTRQVIFGGVTHSPTDIWMKQQARNFSMTLTDLGLSTCKYLVHDNDPRWRAFDRLVKADSITPVRTCLYSPMMNGIAERFVGEVRQTLDKFILLGCGHLKFVLKSIQEQHNYFRPHQGIGNTVPLEYEYARQPVPFRNVRRKEWLAGLLWAYEQGAKVA